MTSEHIVCEQDGHVLKVTINRPEKKNALTRDMYAALAHALTEAGGNPEVRCIFLTGTGDTFTAGNDLMDFKNNPPSGPDAPVFQFMQAVTTSEKPIVMAVNGMAVGIGLTMLAYADVAIAAKSAFMSAPFVDLALVPELASSLMLPQQIGHAFTSDLFLTGRRLTAEEAVACGLISRIADDDLVLAEGLGIARAIAAKAPEAVKLTRELIRNNAPQIPDRMLKENTLFRERLQSAEFFEAVMAFMEKRTPDFG